MKKLVPKLNMRLNRVKKGQKVPVTLEEYYSTALGTAEEDGWILHNGRTIIHFTDRDLDNAKSQPYSPDGKLLSEEQLKENEEANGELDPWECPLMREYRCGCENDEMRYTAGRYFDWEMAMREAEQFGGFGKLEGELWILQPRTGGGNNMVPVDWPLWWVDGRCTICHQSLRVLDSGSGK